MAAYGETGQYTGEHSISIRTKVGRGSWSSWYDICERWHLVPASRPKINMPPLKSSQFDNPGGDGIFDMTETITGFPIFGQRTGSLDFFVLNGWDRWNLVYDDIANSIHGRNVQFKLNDDRDWYYNGRLTLNEWKSDEARSTIVIDYDFDPYKLAVFQSSDWQYYWNDVGFGSSISPPYNPTKDPYKKAAESDKSLGKKTNPILSLKTYQVPFTVGTTITFNSDEVTRPVTPIIRLEDGSNCPLIEFRNPELYGNTVLSKYDLVVGDNHFMDLILTGFNPGNVNSITFKKNKNTDTVNGVVTITYRNGRL